MSRSESPRPTSNIPAGMMLRRLFPERIFARKLSADAERRLKLVQARADEALLRAHVENALSFVDALAEELPFDRAIDTYVRAMAIPEPLGSTVATRTLVALGRDLIPARTAEHGSDVEDSGRPRLRLNEAVDARQRAIKRA